MNFKVIQNIKNIKIISFVLVFFLGLGANFGFLGLWAALSYGVAFFGFFGIFLSLYLSLNARLQNLSQEPYFKNVQQEEGKKITFFEHLSLGLGISFGFARIFAYSLLILALITLMEFGIFDVYGVLFGILFGICALVICFL